MPKDEPKQFGKKELNDIIEEFTNHWGIPPEPKVMQRRYASHIYRLYGDNALDFVKFALSIQKDHFAPQITDPKDLYYKHLKVMDYYRKNNEKSNNNVRRAG